MMSALDSIEQQGIADRTYAENYLLQIRHLKALHTSGSSQAELVRTLSEEYKALPAEAQAKLSPPSLPDYHNPAVLQVNPEAPAFAIAPEQIEEWIEEGENPPNIEPCLAVKHDRAETALSRGIEWAYRPLRDGRGEKKALRRVTALLLALTGPEGFGAHHNNEVAARLSMSSRQLHYLLKDAKQGMGDSEISAHIKISQYFKPLSER